MQETTPAPPVAPEDISEHPLAQALREVFWDLEKIFGFGIDEMSDDEVLAAIRAIRDKARKALVETPSPTTPVIQSILPSINAAIALLMDSYGNADEVLGVLLTLTKVLAPSPASSSKRIS